MKQGEWDNAEEYKCLWKEHGIEVDFEFPVLSALAPSPAIIIPGQAPSASLPSPIASSSLSEISETAKNCSHCGLCQSRTKVVFGTGSLKPRVLFVGEGPGPEEDQLGEPFVGAAGELLNKIIEAMCLKREQVYLTSVVKCLAPENRAPQADEIERCLPYLKSQIEILEPEVIVALGLTAATVLTGQQASMALLRGRFQPLAWNASIQVLPTYHPAFLLRNPATKKMAWEDMKLIIRKLKLQKLS